MSEDNDQGAAPVAAPHMLKHIGISRHKDGIDQPARPLGEKRQALQARRAHAAAQAVGQVGTKPLVAFDVRPTSAGLLVERTQSHPLGACLVQTMLFSDLGMFDRWCDADPGRFEDPLRFSQLRRDGHEAFCRQR